MNSPVAGNIYLLGSSVDGVRSGTDVDGVESVTDVVVLLPMPTLKNDLVSLFYVTDIQNFSWVRGLNWQLPEIQILRVSNR